MAGTVINHIQMVIDFRKFIEQGKEKKREKNVTQIGRPEIWNKHIGWKWFYNHNGQVDIEYKEKRLKKRE